MNPIFKTTKYLNNYQFLWKKQEEFIASTLFQLFFFYYFSCLFFFSLFSFLPFLFYTLSLPLLLQVSYLLIHLFFVSSLFYLLYTLHRLLPSIFNLCSLSFPVFSSYLMFSYIPYLPPLLYIRFLISPFTLYSLSFAFFSSYLMFSYVPYLFSLCLIFSFVSPFLPLLYTLFPRLLIPFTLFIWPTAALLLHPSQLALFATWDICPPPLSEKPFKTARAASPSLDCHRHVWHLL